MPSSSFKQELKSNLTLLEIVGVSTMSHMKCIVSHVHTACRIRRPLSSGMFLAFIVRNTPNLIVILDNREIARIPTSPLMKLAAACVPSFMSLFSSYLVGQENKVT